MRRLYWLVWHEVRVLLVTPASYIAAVLGLGILGMLYLWMIYQVSARPTDLSPTTLFFGTFWLPALLLVPMLTMRSVAEERRLGTLEAMLAASVRPWQLVVAKFLAAYALYLSIWLVTLSFPLLTAQILEGPEVSARLLVPWEWAGALTFVALTGALFIAVGVFSSSMTRSQLVAGMLTFSIIFILVIGVWVLRDAGSNLLISAAVDQDFLSYGQVLEHFEVFVSGVYDTRPFVYYITSTALMLAIAALVVERKA